MHKGIFITEIMKIKKKIDKLSNSRDLDEFEKDHLWAIKNLLENLLDGIYEGE